MIFESLTGQVFRLGCALEWFSGMFKVLLQIAWKCYFFSFKIFPNSDYKSFLDGVGRVGYLTPLPAGSVTFLLSPWEIGCKCFKVSRDCCETKFWWWKWCHEFFFTKLSNSLYNFLNFRSYWDLSFWVGKGFFWC